MAWNEMGGMMGWGGGCGVGGYGIIGALYQILILVILALIVVWLYKNVVKTDSNKKRK